MYSCSGIAVESLSVEKVRYTPVKGYMISHTDLKALSSLVDSIFVCAEIQTYSSHVLFICTDLPTLIQVIKLFSTVFTA